MINRNRHRFELKLWAPLFFVQVWAWERLVSLHPEQAQNQNMVSGVRIGRWHDLKQWGVMNVRTTIDSSGETFQWRPYALAVEGWLVPKFYKEREEWTVVEGRNLDQEMESFVRCLRVSELVGLDCQEPYRPNRVAMQFGYDQDFPQWIPHSPSSLELAWYNYNRPIDSDLRLYYPSRLFESDVTLQYLKWWRKEVLFLPDALTGWSHGRRSKRRSKRLCNSPVFALNLKQVKVETDWDVSDVPPGLSTECQLKQVENYPAVPPGFQPVVPPGFHRAVPPRLKQKHIAEVTVYKPIDYAHDGSGSSSVVPPKCNKENYKEKSMEVGQTVACDVLPPGSTEKYTNCEHDGNESNRNTARDLMTTCDDLITVIELQLSELERQVASHRRC